eukprot:m51a1_g6150 hypothetical protein (533) ;mRNA; f:299154-301044
MQQHRALLAAAVVVAALAVAVCGKGHPSIALRDPNAFELFKQQYHRSYASKAEGTDRRRAIFQAKVRKIEAIQAEQPTATFGINEASTAAHRALPLRVVATHAAALPQFADLTDEEFGSTHLAALKLEGSLPAAGDIRSHPALLGRGRDRRSLPASYTSPYVSRTARHQMNCAASWAFATCGLVEAAWKKANGVDLTLAPQQLLDCTEGTCSSGSPAAVIGYVRQLSGALGGLAEERFYGYIGADRPACSYEGYRAAASVQRWGTTLADESAAMPQTLVASGALVALINADTLGGYTGGVVEPTQACMRQPNHAVLIVGYDNVSFFRIRKGVNACNIAQAGGIWAEAPTCTVASGGACAYGKEVGNDGQWGDWGYLSSCAAGRLARGFVTKSEGNQGKGDDTALNSVRLVCEGSSTQDGPTSLQGPWGSWDEPVLCPAGSYVSAFQVQEEKFCGAKCDDTALNAIKVRCRNRAGLEVLVDVSHTKTSWGEWSKWYSCPAGTAVTGIRTRVEPRQGDGDDTALNAIRLRCSAI